MSFVKKKARSQFRSASLAEKKKKKKVSLSASPHPPWPLPPLFRFFFPPSVSKRHKKTCLKPPAHWELGEKKRRGRRAGHGD